MRPQGCQRCRSKHQRCTIDGGTQRCDGCEKANEPCLPPPAKGVRLKAVYSVIEQSRSSEQGGREVPFVYACDHVWVDFETPVQFVDGNDHEEILSVSPVPSSNDDEGRTVGHNVKSHIEDTNRATNASHLEISNSFDRPTPQPFGGASTGGSSQLATSPAFILSPFQQQRTPSGLLPIISPSSTALLYEPTPLWPLNSQTEAELLQHFINNIGPQLDVTDHLSHFTTVVPQRAIHCPLLFYAIVAAASVHRSRVSGVPDQCYQEYQAKCIRILLRFLDDLEYSPDENLLAAIVILRKGEEMSEDDRMCHLLGSSRVINSIGEVAATGGLGEAAAWLVLRQSIYVSLTGRTPLNVNLSCYKGSSVFLGLTDHAWANRIVFTFAETLVFSNKVGTDIIADTESWHRLRQAALQWNQEKPDTFLPVFENSNEPQSLDDPAHERSQSPFPTISMLQAPHVIGLMYYHLTLIMLTLTDPSTALRTRGLESLRLWRETEGKVRHDLRRCVGLAVSNSHVPAANFEASHILHACGSCLSSPAERRGAVDFLRGVRGTLGWDVDHVVEYLERHWRGDQ